MVEGYSLSRPLPWLRKMLWLNSTDCWSFVAVLYPEGIATLFLPLCLLLFWIALFLGRLDGIAESTVLLLDKTAVPSFSFVSDYLPAVIADFAGPNPPLLFWQIPGYLVFPILLHVDDFVEDGWTFSLHFRIDNSPFRDEAKMQKILFLLLLVKLLGDLPNLVLLLL